MIKKLVKNFSGIILVFMVYFAWCCMSVSYNSGLFLVLFAVSVLGALLIFILNQDIVLERAPWLNVFLALAGVVIGKGSIKEAFRGKEAAKHVLVNMFGRAVDRGEFMIGICSLIFAIALIAVIFLKREFYLEQAKKLPGFVLKHKWFSLLLLCTLLLSYDSEWKQFKWDGLLYYQTSATLDLTNIGEMGVYGHVAQGFSIIVKCFEYLTGATGVALALANVVLFIVSICYVYALIELILPGRGEAFRIAATAVYAFSPFYLGMVNYYNLDYFLMCLLPATIYYAYTEKWIQMTVVSVLFCFSKEPAVIIYGAFCTGMVINDLVKYFASPEADRKIKAVFLYIFSTIHYYYMALAGLLWILTFELLGPWVGGSHDVGISSDYIISKLEVFYLLNFNWVFLLLALTAAVAGVLKASFDRKDLYIILPLLVSLIGFTLFNLVFITANHPRYIDSVPFMLYLTAIYLIDKVWNKKTGTIACIIMSLLLLIQSFYTIDPVSLLVFDRVNTGDATIITTSSRIGDSSQYNKQMLWAEPGLNQAFADAIEADSQIVLTAFDETTYTTDGMAAAPVVTYTTQSEVQYWDTGEGRRVPEKYEGTEEISIIHIAEEGSLAEADATGELVSVIYSDLDDTEKVAAILKQIDISDSQDYSYRGWIFHRATGKIR